LDQDLVELLVRVQAVLLHVRIHRHRAINIPKATMVKYPLGYIVLKKKVRLATPVSLLIKRIALIPLKTPDARPVGLPQRPRSYRPDYRPNRGLE
jgi:hypothetical protein